MMEKSFDAFTCRKGRRKTAGEGTAGAIEKKRERHDNYQGFVPIVSAHSPPLTLAGPELVARRRRLRRRAARCSSSRLRFFRQQQQQHEPTTLVILRRGLHPVRDRSRGILLVIAAAGPICHPASRRTTPKHLLLLRLSGDRRLFWDRTQLFKRKWSDTDAVKGRTTVRIAMDLGYLKMIEKWRENGRKKGDISSKRSLYRNIFTLWICQILARVMGRKRGMKRGSKLWVG